MHDSEKNENINCIGLKSTMSGLVSRFRISQTIVLSASRNHKKICIVKWKNNLCWKVVLILGGKLNLIRVVTMKMVCDGQKDENIFGTGWANLVTIIIF